MSTPTPDTIADPLVAPWLHTFDAQAPCGPDLEYDGDFMALQARLQPVAEVQYGPFTGRREGPDWVEVERQCRALLQRSRDITLLVWLARCRTRRAGAAGASEGMALLAQTLERFPDHIHPQADPGEPGEGASPSLRANALAALVDPEGWLADLRAVVLVSQSAAHLTVRDIERSRLRPRPADALDPDAVQAQLEALARQQPTEWLALARTARQVQAIVAWCEAHLPDDGPDLRALTDLLAPFAPSAARVADDAVHDLDPAAARPSGLARSDDADIATATATPAAAAPVTSQPAATSEPAGDADRPEPADRAAARRAIVRARDWFEHHEPSSPVGLLLRQADRLVGRTYAEVADAIPAELLARWGRN